MKSVVTVDDLFCPPDPSPFPPRRLHFFYEAQCDAAPDAIAVEYGEGSFTYAELDRRANQLAHALVERGAGPDTTVGILLHRSLHTYVALLGVLKAGAAFVPIDPSFPSDRIAFIAEDAALICLISTSSLRPITSGLPCPRLELDEEAPRIAAMPATRPVLDSAGDPLAYIIYTSGSTGRPKGVAVLHSNICHFLSVVTPIYGVRSGDRVYHGMTIAFDFSIEEVWPAFIAGATLVAGPGDSRRLGPELATFLEERKITVLCCVPTLLATLDREIASIRLLNLGGEACPRDLVQRWDRPGRRILNTYGPTETTVTATWTELHPDQPVTIGHPLPGYQVYILDEHLQPVPPGTSGEICIGGKGVALGYVNRPDLTRDRFVPDPFLHGRPGARLYRTGDLGRFNLKGEIEYLGRIDSQVKIRGYRIELAEIEAVFLEDDAVENAIVATAEVNGSTELAAYLTLRSREDNNDRLRPRLQEVLRRRLPAYMVPAYIEVLDAIPMLASGKADRSRLPQPTTARLLIASGKSGNPPATPTEKKLAKAWQAIFQCADLSGDTDFFADLGGHSLLAARTISHLRQDTELQHLAIGDLYLHPTIAQLARFVDQSRPAASAEAQAAATQAKPEPYRARSGSVALAGAAQLVLLYLLFAVFAAPSAALLTLRHGQTVTHLMDRFALIVPAALILTSFLLPVAAKWLLIGRFRPGRHRVWGWYYCRWWLLRKIFLVSPMNIMAGSPLLGAYARLLGARIGRGCHLGSGLLSLPDLLEIGDGANIGYEAELQAFFVEDGWLHLDRIRIGANAFVGAKTVILPGGTVGAFARVKDQSLVARGQVIPEGETWAGSPAQSVSMPDPLLDAIEAQPASPRHWSLAHLGGFTLGLLLLELLPMVLFAPGLLFVLRAEELGGIRAALASLPVAGLLFVLTTCVLVALGKRIVLPRTEAGIFPLYSGFGVRKWFADHLMSLSLAATNTLYATLYTPAWLRLLGATIGPWSEVSTVSHIDPDLLELGTETFVADMASIGASTFHQGWIGMGTTCVGSRSFVGNAALVRARTRIPENCLLGVQSVPPEHAMEAGTSWLGSPALFLPRRQESERFSDELIYHPSRGLVAGRLAIEFVRIVLPAALLYLAGWLTILGSARLALHASRWTLIALMPALLLASAFATVAVTVLLKWMIVGRYRPRVEPLWSTFVRRSELVTGLYESAAVPLLLGWLTGTPFLALFLRAFGARIGRRTYLDTTYLTEFDLVHVGDDSSIGGPTSLQTHLFEDRVMKMSHLRIGQRCTIGPRAVVLYDTEVGNDASLDGLSLVMKGESLPAGTAWRGIPARRVG